MTEAATTTWNPPDLRGKIAIVAGASRGCGRGMALALGDAGATVYAAGRTVRGGPAPFDKAPGTIDDTAEEITRRGGRGIAARCDFTVEAEVAALFDRVRAEHGRLDLLANGVWGSSSESYSQMSAKQHPPFWELPSVGWTEGMLGGAYSHLLAALYAARLMAPQRSGLIVSVSELNDDYSGSSLFWLYTTLGHRAINRMVAAMSGDLAKHGIAIVALLPGFMRTERVLMHFDSLSPAEAEKAKKSYRFDKSESTEYSGRAVAHLAADPDAGRWNGKAVAVGELARAYGFRDTDGRQPHFYDEVVKPMFEGKGKAKGKARTAKKS